MPTPHLRGKFCSWVQGARCCGVESTISAWLGVVGVSLKLGKKTQQQATTLVSHAPVPAARCPWAPTPRGCVGGQWHVLCPVVTYPEWTSSQLPAPAGDTAPAAAQPPAAWVGPKGFQFHAGLLFSFWFYFCTPGPRRTRRVLLSVPRWTEHKH